LVESLSDITSIYSLVGYESDNLNFYMGVKPKVIKGDLDLKIPSEVNTDGEMIYQHHKVQIQPDSGTFFGIDYSVNLFESGSNQSLDTKLLFDNTRSHQVNINYQWRF